MSILMRILGNGEKNGVKQKKENGWFTEEEKKKFSLFFELCKIIKNTKEQIQELNRQLEENKNDSQRAAETRDKISECTKDAQILRRNFTKAVQEIYLMISMISQK